MFARTSRLFLRPGWVDDAPALATLLNNANVSCALARVPHPYTLNDAEAFLGEPRAPDDVTCLIFKRTPSAELIGGIGLVQNDAGFELGYWLTQRHWGEGYATEAGAAVLQTAYRALRIERVIARHSLDNPASGKVLRKLGFKPTGHIRMMHSLARGCEMPCAEYAIDLSATGERDMPHPIAA